ncbi:Os01g0162001 [Oryza sativa Japonica Group]|uniref:Os01g0162001 protein n=1 Tax=Oryza sativa subsp. japonica TaxID=39947 RepID=A0A0P0UZ09_ORYSJ|nr:Os01g0162001 [Oryza sativa Japonica Group]
MGMSQEQRVRLSVGLLVASSSRSSSITTTRAPGVRGNVPAHRSVQRAHFLYSYRCRHYPTILVITYTKLCIIINREWTSPVTNYEYTHTHISCPWVDKHHT